MAGELERLTQLAAEYRREGNGLLGVLDRLISEDPPLREDAFLLAMALRRVFDLPVADMKAINARVRGEWSREELESWLEREA